MKNQLHTDQTIPKIKNENRDKLLADLPVTEYQFNLAGISTAVLIGGEGQPVILLHGPGETSAWWMGVIPKLVETHQVIVPDLPGHGASKINDSLKADLVFSWLNELTEKICDVPPILVGNILGGSIAARFAVNHGDQISHLVLVNSLGLSKFRPAPFFAFGLIRFMLRPTKKNFNRFLPQCMYDVDNLKSRMGEKWEPFLAYNLECARSSDRKKAVRVLMNQMGIPKIPSADLQQITIPVSLIWGRHDRANKLQIAMDASEQYGWPLYIIEEARDDPKLEQPEKFINALYKILNTEEVNYAD